MASVSSRTRDTDYNNLLQAIFTGNRETVHRLCKKYKQNPAFFNQINENDRSPLLNAVMSEDVDIIQTLLDAGADPNKKNSRGYCKTLRRRCK